ncbi:MAG: aminotransferase class I/II-fold pyridoxal phosphate-dependent enzyme [Rhizobiales bacterium]|nr:aminotransferase class I/II-fold pyridoxal phosphate-dependent enzyme [Hyphomicrobiales bacterium]
MISLAINENAYGASPRAVEAAIARLSAPHRYPDPSSSELRLAIGTTFDLDPDRIICGNGSEELLDVIGRLFARSGDRIIMSQSGFFQFALVASRLGAELVRAPERDLVTDADALTALATPEAKLVYLAIPNNPTGVAMPISEVQRLHAALPGHVVLVLDLAYGEFLAPGDLAALMDLAAKSDNVIATRTFSKAYGLAALRVGWALAPRWMMPGLNLLRGVGNINAPAQSAATAALADRDFLNRVVEGTAKERDFLGGHLTRLGLRHVQGLGNFLLTEFPGEDSKRAQDFIDFAMREAGIWLRPVGEPGFPNHSRIGLGSRAENELLVATLFSFLHRRA